MSENVKRKKTEKCEKCGKLFSRQGIAVHQRHCSGSSAGSGEERETVVQTENIVEVKKRFVSEWDEEKFSSRPVVVYKRETASEKLMSNISERLPDILGMLSPLFASAAEALIARSQGQVPEESTYDTSAALPAQQIVAPVEEPKPKKYYNFSNFPRVYIAVLIYQKTVISNGNRNFRRRSWHVCGRGRH